MNYMGCTNWALSKLVLFKWGEGPRDNWISRWNSFGKQLNEFCNVKKIKE